MSTDKQSNETEAETVLSSSDDAVYFASMKCGYIMPIADVEGYRRGHWLDIQAILDEVCEGIGFSVHRVVSHDLDVGTIHKRIVSNIYADDIVICDLSSKNPNVMFEVGMRIAFDKPLVVIKDEKTGFCFDSGTIDHLTYPHDLRYSEIYEFKENLKDRIITTIKSAKIKIKNHESPILSNFGALTTVDLNIDNVSEMEAVRSDILELKDMILNVVKNNNADRIVSDRNKVTSNKIKVLLSDIDKDEAEKIATRLELDNLDSSYYSPWDKTFVFAFSRFIYAKKAMEKIKKQGLSPSLLA